MPKRAGHSADGKGSAKAGYLTSGSIKPASSNRGGAPPKTKITNASGMMRSAKAGK